MSLRPHKQYELKPHNLYELKGLGCRALEELKSNRLEMLKEFAEDRSCGWTVNIAHRSSHSTMTSDDTESEWLNYRRMADLLKLDWKDEQDKALFRFGVAQVQKRKRPTWPNEFEYRRVIEKEIEKHIETDDIEFEAMPAVDAAKAKSKAKANASPLQIDWANVCKKSRGSFAKNIKKLDALLAKVRHEKAYVKAEENSMAEMDNGNLVEVWVIRICNYTPKTNMYTP